MLPLPWRERQWRRAGVRGKATLPRSLPRQPSNRPAASANVSDPIASWHRRGRRCSWRQRRLPHLADTVADRLNVLRTEIRVMREAGFQFIDWLGCDACGQYFVQAYESVVIALEARDTGFNAQAGTGRLGNRGQARQRRQ